MQIYRQLKFNKVGKFILEEDIDDVSLEKIRRRFFTFENNMQHKNLKTKDFHEFQSNIEKDDSVDYDEFGDAYDDAMKEIIEKGIESYATEYKNNPSTMQMLALTDMTYSRLFGFSDEKNTEKLIKTILEDNRFNPELERLPGLEPYSAPLQSVIRKSAEDEEVALAEMEALVTDYPDVPDLGVFYIYLLRDMDKITEAVRLTDYWYNRAGNNHAVKLIYAERLIDTERYDEVFDLFGKRSGLDALTAENVFFTEVMIAEFCACYVSAWLAKDNISRAEPYYQLLVELGTRTPFTDNALMNMMTKKREAIRTAKKS